MYEFEIMHLDWYKRRRKEKVPTVESVVVIDFQKVDNHQCAVDVVFSDDTKWVNVMARVNHNVSYEYQPDGSCAEIHRSWGVQAQKDGVGVLVKLKE